ncbi:sensor histidine kinase [Photobacterium arenosum]|uniref:sensor histidine kinase n=1 Tax=Photobacterium arenosum TaxID=2774143 RepID=UPI002889E4AA|nr:HAMP domain-containing sensor histidine kinase [Photobacterium arenosum]
MARLQRSIKISHNFNSDLSHQLRTPLAEMKMQLAMYRRDFQIEKLNDVDRNITLMTRLTEQMLHYVKAQNSTVSNKYWSCLDLVEFCRNFCEKYAPMVFNQGQAIAFETKIESAVCRIDEALLESALLNLIENALKYGKSHQGEGEIVLKLTSGNDSLSLSVTDQGSGVCDQDLESMLERKVRLDRSKQGFGLGLAIVKQVAEMHGGQLEITNASPRGLCITLSGLKINQAPSTKPFECRLVQAE